MTNVRLVANIEKVGSNLTLVDVRAISVNPDTLKKVDAWMPSEQTFTDVNALFGEIKVKVLEVIQSPLSD